MGSDSRPGSGPTRRRRATEGVWRRRGRFGNGAPCAEAGSRCPEGIARSYRVRCRRQGCEGGRCACAGCKRGREGLREIMAPAEAVIAFVGFVVEGEVAVFPVEGAGVDDDAADAVSVTAKPLGQRVNNDGGAMPIGLVR